MLVEFNNYTCGFIKLKINFTYLFIKFNKQISIFSHFNLFRLNSIRGLNLRQVNEYKHFFNRPHCIYMIGLGYKNFILGESLFILIGDCNYLIFQISPKIKVFCKKNKIYLISNDSTLINDFSSKLKKFKKLNMYKGKGIINFRNFKFTKLKIGKKQKV